ncbi:MAG TPA: hypothetical protein VEC11_16685 [Allosphingosinicella sp.]|nr:hypothetical protein [Allosphingosinicella sp.]
MEENEPNPPLVGLIILFIGAGLIVVGVAFLTYGLYALVGTGLWPSYPFSKMLTEIGIPLSPGLPGPLAWIVGQSACVVLLSVGALIAALGAWRIASFHRRRRREAEEAAAAA